MGCSVVPSGLGDRRMVNEPEARQRLGKSEHGGEPVEIAAALRDLGALRDSHSRQQWRLSEADQDRPGAGKRIGPNYPLTGPPE